MHRLEFGVWWMSRQAIAAVIARSDLASGERLVALSLASFAGRENRAWPGAPAASARAGLSRSRYQQAREQLVVAAWLPSTSARPAVAARARSPSCSLTPVRGGTARSTSSCSRACWPTAQLTGPSGCCSRRWRRSRTRTERCATCRPSSCAPRPGLPTGPTAERARRCSLRTARARQRRRRPREHERVEVRDRARAAPGSARSEACAPPREHASRAAATSDGGALRAVHGCGEKGGQDRTLPRGRPILTGVSTAKGGHDRTVSLTKTVQS
jgi:hypothetical protein